MSFIRFNNKFIRLDGKLANLTESNEVLSTFTLNFDNCSYSLGGTEEYTFVEGTTWAEWLADDRFNHYPSLAYTDYDQKYAAGNRDGYIKVREYQNPDNIEAGFLC